MLLPMSNSDEAKPVDNVVNVEEAEAQEHLFGEHWGGSFRALTPAMRPGGGKLGVNRTICPPGRATVPFHTHQLEDEAFYILSGRGIFRYGETLREVGPGDCLSCPAGTKTGHQLANPFEEDLVYLAIGNREPEEVCFYPDNGKVMVRGLGTVGRLEKAPYLDGEPDRPKIFDLFSKDS